MEGKLPSIAQMRCRSESGHLKILRAKAAGTQYVNATTSLSELRGFRTARLTLIRWGCLTTEDGEEITDRGRALLAALAAEG